MKKTFSTLLSLFTIAVLFITTFSGINPCAENTISTVTPSDSITVYFDNSYTNWDKVSLYYYGDVSNTWPGDSMKKDETGKYYVEVPNKAKYIIFNDGGNKSQSNDISSVADKNEYIGVENLGSKVIVIPKVEGKIPEIPTSGDTTPKQVNVHVGSSYDNVNLTYTTIGPANGTITVKDSEGKIINNFSADSKYSYLSSKFTHTATITGLNSKKEYSYTINSGNKSFTGSFKTVTSLNESNNETMKFAFLADTQVSNSTNAKTFGATCNMINKLNDINLVYIAGDITNNADDESQYESLFNNGGLYKDEGQNMFSSHLISVTQGNHDVSNFTGHIKAPSASSDVSDDVYSFNYGAAKIIVLNLETAKNNNDIRNAQKEYLEKEVKEAKDNDQWVIVSFHKSIYTGASHIVDSDIKAAREYWGPILSNLNVDVVLQGHDHVYARGFITREGNNANLTKNTDGSYSKHDGSPLYMVGGHAGGLKWYKKIDYKVSQGDPLAENYSFLDINSADSKYNEDGLTSSEKQEQFYTIFEVSKDKISSKTYTFKYDTNTDTVVKEPTIYDSITISKEQISTNTPSSTDTPIISTNTPSDTFDSHDMKILVYGSLILIYIIGSQIVKLRKKHTNNN